MRFFGETPMRDLRRI